MTFRENLNEINNVEMLNEKGLKELIRELSKHNSELCCEVIGLENQVQKLKLEMGKENEKI